jgi:hypothetical protein
MLRPKFDKEVRKMSKYSEKERIPVFEEIQWNTFLEVEGISGAE